MQERKGAVTFQGAPLTLLGNPVKVGDLAHDVSLTATDMNEAGSPLSAARFASSCRFRRSILRYAISKPGVSI